MICLKESICHNSLLSLPVIFTYNMLSIRYVHSHHEEVKLYHSLAVSGHDFQKFWPDSWDDSDHSTPPIAVAIQAPRTEGMIEEHREREQELFTHI
jgi:hypothetical protein